MTCPVCKSDWCRCDVAKPETHPQPAAEKVTETVEK